MAIREGIFLGPSHGTLVEITTQGAISYASQTFRENDRPNPKKYKETANLEEFYRGGTEPTKTATQIQNNKRPYPSASSLKSSKRKQQRPTKPRVSWQSEVSYMYADRDSI